MDMLWRKLESQTYSKCNGYSKTKNGGTGKETANYTLDSIVMTKKKKKKSNEETKKKKSYLRTLPSTKAQRTRVYKKKKKQPLFLFKEESWQLCQHSVHPYLSPCRFARFIDKLLSFFPFFFYDFRMLGSHLTPPSFFSWFTSARRIEFCRRSELCRPVPPFWVELQ